MSSSAEKYKSKPYKHQLDCLAKFGAKQYFALLAEMGTGKTFIILNNMADLWGSQELNGALVLAPSGVHTNWTSIEIPKHMPDYVRCRTATWHSGANKKEQLSLDALFESKDSSELRILAMNWEALQTEKGFDFAKRFCMSCSKLMIVGDESTMMKNPSAARTKALMKLKKYSTYRRIMNGTPVSNSPFDLFSQFTFLDESILGTTSYFAFKAEYADMLQDGNRLLATIKQRSGSRFTPQIVAKGKDGRPQYKNLDKLEALIAPHSFRVLKKDCLDLPEKIYKTVFYKMSAAQRKAYDLMKEENRMLLLDEAVPVANKLVALGKLAQICSGYYLPPASKEPIRIPGGSPKIEMLVETAERIVLEQGKKIIVWARYHIELEDIAIALKAAGLKVVQYDGRFSKTEREQAKQDFQFGDADVFVGQQQSGGVGITLTAAKVVIYFSNTFSLYDRLQSEDRAHRIGQDENVLYLDFVAENSVEHKTLSVLRSKKNVADIITGDNALEMT
jgi:SNF2 family DNA or RNA helicase